MTIFVTGATGFIGYNLTERLLQEGHKIVALVRPSSQNYVDLLKDRVVFTYDSSIEGLADTLTKYSVDIVMHLASLLIGEHQPKDVEPLISSNILLGTNVLEAMRLSGCRNIINAGTSLQHYNNEAGRATCLYGATKEAFQKILDLYSDAYELAWISVEIFNVYGQNDLNYRLLALLKNAYVTQTPLELSAGEQYMDLLHVQDIVDAFCHAISLLDSGINGRYMVSSRRAIQIKDLIAMIDSILGKKLPVKLGAKPYRQRETFVPWTSGIPLPNWQPKISLEEGLKDYFYE